MTLRLSTKSERAKSSRYGKLPTTSSSRSLRSRSLGNRSLGNRSL